MQDADGLIRALFALEKYLGNNDVDQAGRLRELVAEGHDLAQRNLDELHRTFVTPIDREDIYAIITSIDNVFDYVTTALRELELLAVPGERWMQEMIRQLQQGAGALKQGFTQFLDNPSEAGVRGDDARCSERNVEEIYRDALKVMFGGEAVADLRQRDSSVTTLECLDFVFELMKRREIYRHLSNGAGADRLGLAKVGELLHDLGVKYD